MPLTYNFSFGSRYAGRDVHILDASQQEVSGSPFTLDANGDYSLATTEGRYTGRVSNPAVFAGDGYSVVDGELDVPASIANVPGASETAYFVGTLVGASDNQSTQVELTVKPGTDAKDWAPVVAGAVELDPATAGDCRVNAVAQTNLDYSGTTAPAAPGDSAAYYSVLGDGSSVVDLDAGTTVGDGSDEVSLPIARGPGASATGGTITFEAAALAHDENADPITDGVATHQVAVNITRLAPAPALS